MTDTVELYAKAFESNKREDWEAYDLASKEQIEKIRLLPRLAIDNKHEKSLDDEWDDYNSLGRPLNSYARHWWGE